MKKLLSLLLAAILLCSLCGAGALAEKYEEIFGEYTLVNMLSADSDEDMTEMVQAMAAMGMSATLVINEDGSAVMDMFGEQQELRFDFDTQTVTDGEDAIPYSFNGEELIIGNEEQGFVFSKAGVELPERSGGPFSFYLLTELLDADGVDLLPGIKENYGEDALFALYLFKDGSGILEMYGESTAVQFDFDTMTATAEDETASFTLEGDFLSILDSEEVTSNFVLADPGIIGPYQMTSMVSENEDPAAEDDLFGENLFEALNIWPTLNISEDGSAILSFLGQELEMQFDFEAMTVEGEDEILDFSYEKGVLTISGDSYSMTFGRILPEDSSDSNANSWITQAINQTTSSDVNTEKEIPSIEETVLLDQDGIKITAKNLNVDGTFGPEIKLLIENNRAEAVTVQTRNSSVNGYMVETMMSTDIAPGKKANDTLDIMSSDLERAGITTIADIEFAFHVFDSDSWDTIFDSEIIKIETSAAEGFSYTFDDSGKLVYNENGLEIVVKGLSDENSWLGPSVLVYLSNTSDRDITVQARDVSINGFMVDPFFSCDLLAGKHAVDTITFSSSDLEENDIASIETLELYFHVFDLESWDDIFNSPPITIEFD